MSLDHPLTLNDRVMAALPDDKARGVVVAAYGVFLNYGIKRASMQDIADAAGMSRAALYLHYKNKNDIFRALMMAYFEGAKGAVEDVLARYPDPVEALHMAFAEMSGEEATSIFTSPHADEFISLKHSAAADLVAEGYEWIAQVLADWMTAGVSDGRFAPEAVGSDAKVTARAMMAGIDGLKQAGYDWAGYTAARNQLAQLYGRALRA